jgi:hypothetical protein
MYIALKYNLVVLLLQCHAAVSTVYCSMNKITVGLTCTHRCGVCTGTVLQVAGMVLDDQTHR